MNLHSIVAPCIAAVSPPIMGTIRVSTGYTTASDGSRTPTYATGVTASIDVQPLSAKDLQQVAALNIQGVTRKAWFNGNIEGIDRQAGKGGDLITFASGSMAGTWLVAIVFETWDADGWCSVGLSKQIDS